MGYSYHMLSWSGLGIAVFFWDSLDSLDLDSWIMIGQVGFPHANLDEDHEVPYDLSHTRS